MVVVEKEKEKEKPKNIEKLEVNMVTINAVVLKMVRENRVEEPREESQKDLLLVEEDEELMVKEDM